MNDRRVTVVRDLVRRLLDDADGTGTAPIVQVGHPVLRAVAFPCDGQLDDADLAGLVALMQRTMRAAPGVGLAAPQIGIPLALAVLEDPGVDDAEVARARERDRLAFRVLVNPAYEPVGEDRVGFYEGCLSVVGYQAVVARPRSVRLRAHDLAGAVVDEVVTGWAARIVQHETDHLGGTLYLDRAEMRSLSATDRLGAHWASQPVPLEASRALGFALPTPAGPGGVAPR